MKGKSCAPNSIDKHVGQRVQLCRIMMGLSQKDLADICGITAQQIQKYEAAGNRIPASRLFKLSTALQTPISFFFAGLPGNVPPETHSGKVSHISQPKPEDPLAKNESLEMINLYWHLPSDERHKVVAKMVRSLRTIRQNQPSATGKKVVMKTEFGYEGNEFGFEN